MLLVRGNARSGLVVGKTVRVEVDGSGGVLVAKVTRVDTSKGVVEVRTNDGVAVEVQMRKTLRLDRDPLSPFMLRDALRPARAADFHAAGANGKPFGSMRPVWFSDGSGPMWASFEKGGRVSVYRDRGLQSVYRDGVPLSELRVGDDVHRGGLNSTPGLDVDTLAHRSADYRVSTLPGQPGYYVLNGKNPAARALVILQGTSKEPHYAIGRRDSFEISNPIDMRGTGPAPKDQDMAVVAIHGAPEGFVGIDTRSVAKALAQEISKVNRQTPGRIRAMQLMSCFQGDRKFHIAGSTPAERFQVQLDQALATQRTGAKVVVLASERPGALASSNGRPLEVARTRLTGTHRAAEVHYETPTFVPAGTQDTLANAGDRAMLKGWFLQAYQRADTTWKGQLNAAVVPGSQSSSALRLRGAVVHRAGKVVVVLSATLLTALLARERVLAWLLGDQAK